MLNDAFCDLSKFILTYFQIPANVIFKMQFSMLFTDAF